MSKVQGNSAATVLDVTSSTFSKQVAVEALRERGFVILRNLFPPSLVDEVVASSKIWLDRPAIAGTPGYSKIDHPKKVLNPFVLGGGVIDLLVNELVLDIVDTTMGDESILAEVSLKFDRPTSYIYFPLHSDFAAGWKKSRSSTFVLSAEEMQNVVGIGGALYLHDTTDGAFVYCEGTHRLMSPHGQELTTYPKSLRDEIVARGVRCDGQKGDLVLFDDRGFHGPDQPASTSRLVILLDYYRIATFGRKQVSPMPIWSTDLARMNERQLRAAGKGASCMVPAAEYTQTRFTRNPLYPWLARAVELAFLHKHWRATLRAMLRPQKKQRAD